LVVIYGDNQASPRNYVIYSAVKISSKFSCGSKYQRKQPEYQRKHRNNKKKSDDSRKKAIETLKASFTIERQRTALFTKAEKERRVVELYEQDYNYREIAQEVHMSLSDISSIVRRHTGEVQIKTNGEQAQTTIDTKAFKLFEEGKTPVQVAIDLDLKSNEVGRLYKEWWQLKGLHQLNQLYEEIGDDIFQFHRTYKYIKDRGYTPHQLIEVANHLDYLPLLRSEREQLTQEIQNLALQKDQLNESITFARMELNGINLGIDVQTKEFERLSNEKRQYESFVASANTSPGYQQVLRIAEAAAGDILKQNQVVLGVALRALFQALKDEPRNELQLLIYGSLTYPIYESRYGNMPRNHLQLRQAVILQAAEEVYNDLLAKAVSTTMASALYTQSRKS